MQEESQKRAPRCEATLPISLFVEQASLNSKAIAQIKTIERLAASLLLYQSVLGTPVGQTFLGLLQSLNFASINWF